MNQNFAIGTDIEEISRFEGKDFVKDKKFLEKIFTQNELEYCFKDSNSASHLCARFCAKESVVKALSEFGIKDVYYSDIEISKGVNQNPVLSISKYPDISAKLSLSHCKTYATATVLLIK